MKKLTYKDFEIGQKVICVESENYKTEDLYNIYLTVGKEYTITDLDFHFPDKICVKKDEDTGNAFFPIENFIIDPLYIRKKKLDTIIKR